MKNCPNCGALLGDTVIKCPECFLDMSDPIKLKEVEEKKKLEAEQKRIEAEQRRIEGEQRWIEEKEKRIHAIKDKNKRVFSMNNLYEYAIETIQDLENGKSNQPVIISTINKYALVGWRLHSIYTNEIGKVSHPQTFGLYTINATIEETVIIFERIVDKANE